MFHYCYCAPPTLLTNMTGCWFCYSNSSASPLFLFSCCLTLSNLPQTSRCHSSGILLDPLKRILAKPIWTAGSFQEYLQSSVPTCSHQGCQAVQGHWHKLHIGPPAPPTTPGPWFTVCPPTHWSTLWSQCYYSEEMSVTSTLEAIGKFMVLSFCGPSRKIAATNLDLF